MNLRLICSRYRRHLSHLHAKCAAESAGPLPAPIPESFRPPEWACHAVWYQIMLDRFRNGDPGNDPDRVHPWTSDWFARSASERRARRGFYESAHRRHYGGDLAGLAEKLPYLRDLGVNALYLTPIFKAPSYHKYDATDYVHVDDHFGTRGDYQAAAAAEDPLDPTTWRWTESDRRFLEFLQAAHTLGFRVIIDGAFSHVGTQHRAFQDVRKHRSKSRYADWFAIESWRPLKYKSWWNYPGLPEFGKTPEGYASPAVKAHILAVTRRWMAPEGDRGAGVDGWRLDVANEIPLPFWAQWRELVKSINPDAYIVGEIWPRADQWLDGRHFDAVMNYEFARAVVAWVFNRKWQIRAGEFDRRLRELRLAYPVAATQVLQNLIGSHDTDRMASMAHNPDRPYNRQNRPEKDGPDYDDGKPPAAAYRRARLAALIQMTYVGTPMIYYGDEVGMWGAADPTCRKPMLWTDLQPCENPQENHVMEDHLAFYRRVIALRHTHPALRTGSYRTLLCDDEANVWAFLRTGAGAHVVVTLNASDRRQHVQVPLPPRMPAFWRSIFGPPTDTRAADRRLTFTVPPIAGIVLHAHAEQ